MNKYTLNLLFILFAGLFYGYGQQGADCSSAIPVCVEASNEFVVRGYGDNDFLGRTEIGCLGKAGANTIESNSYWFRIQLTAEGQFGFDIKPNNPSEDWDFAVFGPDATCGQLKETDVVKCNVNNIVGDTGVGDVSSSASYDSWMDVFVGDEYFILVNNYSGNNAGFTITWTGDIFPRNNNAVLDCEIDLDFGPDLKLCGNESKWLYANIISNGNNVEYNWSKKDNETDPWQPWILPNPVGSHLVTESGFYMVEVIVTDPLTGAIINTFPEDIKVEIYPEPIANQIPDLVFCTDSTSIYNFSLGSVTTDINNTLGDTVEYYESKNRAERGWAEDLLTGNVAINSGVTTTIWARVENVGECYNITSYNVTALPPPIANKPDEDLIVCDTDSDNKFVFNLEDQTDEILKGQENLIVTYYTSDTSAELGKFEIFNPNISDPVDAPPPSLLATTDAYLSESKTIWARVAPTLGSECYDIVSFNLSVVEPAVANPEQLDIDIQQCDDNNDGFYEFDFSTKDAEILGTQDPENFEIYYFASQTDVNSGDTANILPNPYINSFPYNIETIYARIQVKGNTDCFDITSFNLQVFDSAFPAIQENFPNLTYCDDDTNGLYTFDLTERESEVLGIYLPLFNVTYYTVSDYSSSSQIVNPQAYPNLNADYLPQTIYVRVSNKLLNGTEQCEFDTSFNIQVLKLPDAIAYELVQCGDPANPLGTVFNLTEADFYVSKGQPFTVTYHLSPIDAASTSIVNARNDKESFSDSISSTVYARVASANGCYKVVKVSLMVNGTPFPANSVISLTECDDDGTIDGKRIWNLGQTRALILSKFSSTTNLRIAYYRNEEDALSETNIINPDNAYVNEVPYNDIIWVRVESSTNGGCAGIAPLIEITVNPRPEFELDETNVICLNDLPKMVSIYSPKGIYTYEWFDQTGDILSPQSSAPISKSGVYTVIATSNLGCESFPREITITESSVAIISPEDVQVTDNSENNTLTILTANQNLGIGDYEFSLDDVTGPFQDDPTFTQVSPGEHTVFVQEKNGCGIAQTTVFVFGFPNFFTPNNDGENDTWNVRGVDPSLFPESSIHVFDRYGKMLVNITANNDGWDGYYNDFEALSSDYWYLAKITDSNGRSREFKGHFSLIRR